MSIHRVLDDAAQHHGLIRADRAARHGVTRQRLDRIRDRGSLEFLGHELYRVTGSPVTWRQHALGAVWTAGPTAVASHRCAAALWGLAGGRGVEVIVPKGTGHRWSGVRVHETRHLRDVDVDEVDGIPITSVERTLVDMAAIARMGRVARTLDEAHRLELTSFRRVLERLEAMPTRGRKGVRVLRILLAERIGSLADDRDPFEGLMLRLVRSSDLPEPQRQVVVTSGDSRYYLDFGWPEFMVAVECDGLMGHGSAAAQAYDLTRQNEIIEAGWNLRRFSWSAVRLHPERTIDTVRRALLANGWSPPPPTSPS